MNSSDVTNSGGRKREKPRAKNRPLRDPQCCVECDGKLNFNREEFYNSVGKIHVNAQESFTHDTKTEK
jgi:hypothetical protein